MKPRNIGSYTPEHTALCERVLVTVLSSLGAWRNSTRLIGGLVPRYLIRCDGTQETPPPHAGTMDVDLVLDLALLTDSDAYRHLEETLLGLGFSCHRDENSRDLHYRWRKDFAVVDVVVLDLLCDSAGIPEIAHRGERYIPVGLRGAHLALQDFIEVTVEAERLDQPVVISEVVQVANAVPFVVLKALAYQDRHEPKDAYDLIYVLTHYADSDERLGPEAVAAAFAERMAGRPDEPLFREALLILRRYFATDESREGYEKDGSKHYARALTDPSRDRPDTRYCRDAAAVVDEFLDFLEQTGWQRGTGETGY